MPEVRPGGIRAIFAMSFLITEQFGQMPLHEPKRHHAVIGRRVGPSRDLTDQLLGGDATHTAVLARESDKP